MTKKSNDPFFSSLRPGCFYGAFLKNSFFNDPLKFPKGTDTIFLQENAMNSGEISASNSFILSIYFQQMVKILSGPVRFFAEYPRETRMLQPFLFLLISSIFFTGASLTTHVYQNPFLTAGVFMVNSLGMPFLMTFTIFFMMFVTGAEKIRFTQIFAVCAFSWGVTMMVSWIPKFIWFTEPWKWLLIMTGMVKTCRLRWFHALIVVGISIFGLMIFFQSIGELLIRLRGITG